MVAVHTFTPDEVATIRAYCEGELRDEVAKVDITERDHGACVGLIVELADGYRTGFVTVANGRNDATSAAGRLVGHVRRRLNERQAGAS